MNSYFLRTRGIDMMTTGKVYLNQLVYAFAKRLLPVPAAGWLHSRWHWYRNPFSLREKVLWSPTLQAWFAPADETAIECMLRLPNYEPVDWFAPKLGDVVLDVGAYAGWYTLQAARAVGPTGRVVALEPDSDNRRQLERNLLLNEIGNVLLCSTAAWSSTARLGWHRHEHAVWRRVESSNEGQEKVQATTLDELVSSLGLRRVDWIKIDVEGAEVEVLKGAHQTLDAWSPQLFIEIHGTLAEAERLLTSLDFSILSASFDQPPDHHGWVRAGRK